MPSKQASEDFIAIEELVNEIKQNLRLKAAPTTAATAATLFQSSSNEQFLQQAKIYNHTPQQQLIIRKQRSRPSPYNLTATPKPKSFSRNDENNIDDPYELLQSLLKNNKLIQVAVKRLQDKTIDLHTPYSPKQNYFYDSDEDRSPIVMMCQLES